MRVTKPFSGLVCQFSLVSCFCRRYDSAIYCGARLLETAAGIPYEFGLLIFGISIALYTAIGGFRASVLNDALQGLVMLLGDIYSLVCHYL